MTEEEIDRIVIVQADNESAWEKPVKMRKSKSTSVMLPSDLADQAAFLPVCIEKKLSQVA